MHASEKDLMVSTLHGQNLQTESIDLSIVIESGVKLLLMWKLLCLKVYFPISGVAPQMMCIVQAGVQTDCICLHA